MKHIVTLSDYNYLEYGLTMYDSLIDHSWNYVLHYLCCDDKSKDKLDLLNLPGIITYSLQDVEAEPLFQLIKQQPKKDSEGQSPFYFALASFFTNFVMDHYKPWDCIYVDTDIIFYDDISKIAIAVDDNSIGIVTHKHVQPPSMHNAKTGYFNVGVVYFRGDAVGKKCLKWWANVSAHNDHKWFRDFGTCGDQKYLELFQPLFGHYNVHILDREIGHGAPWNFPISTINHEKNTIRWRDNFVLGDPTGPETHTEQPLLFNHFSHFTPDYVNDTYKVDRGGEWGNILPNPGIKETYDKYFQSVKNTKEKYQL